MEERKIIKEIMEIKYSRIKEKWTQIEKTNGIASNRNKENSTHTDIGWNWEYERQRGESREK